ncbi:FAD-dependent oxidoreductase [Gordonia sp. ABSL1-1]|uniref:FAD-dependent oxidoreductase n=1 Tax=Gordonia sp. ABSL1-1 TaxID=3053923 RepID=UPI0025742F3F|nr:FAD-dependent oxidoreductase [Gordonia sp. ABSL1-1]MDL9938390.1 FAD-dependent oxidoreductase [Gordonia sp. ABSL1-1]
MGVPSSAQRRTVAVVGGGVIGLSCALAAADAGWRVRVFDAGAEVRASQVAGGMLGSLGEGHPGEERALALSATSVRRWPALLDRLGDPTVRVACDSLFVASSAADAEYLRGLADFVWAHRPAPADDPGADGSPPTGLNMVSRNEIRVLEPSLSSRLIGGYRARGEWAVDNRRLLAALRTALVAAGAQLVDARIDDLAELSDDQIVVAAGLGATRLLPAVADTLHPAKGEILRLRRTRWSVPPPQHVVRARVDGRIVYLVPRSDGVVVGATQYEPQDASWTEPTVPEAGGVADLLADAIEVMPGLRTYELAEAGAGLRPCTADGLPIVRRLDERTVAAIGHGRNGIVLAPWTAHTVGELLADPDGHSAERDSVGGNR